jgi:hypothetical protein
MGIPTAEIASPVVVVHDQSLDPYLGRHLCDRRREIDLLVRGLGGLYGRGALDGLGARCDGRSRSCRSVPDPRDGVVRPQPWTAVRSVRHAYCC